MKAPETVDFKGFRIPANDTVCGSAASEEVHDLEKAYPHVKEWDVCVQAGGNFGFFPKALAAKFKAVYTFEPDAENFYCLGLNCPDPNVIKFQAALGDKPSLVSVGTPPHESYNPGAKYIMGAGITPTIRIDDLGLSACDFMILDIEGVELSALKGAAKTIKQFHPVIVVEDKEPCYAKFGTKEGETEGYLINNFGYKIIARYGRDILLA